MLAGVVGDGTAHQSAAVALGDQPYAMAHRDAHKRADSVGIARDDDRRRFAAAMSNVDFIGGTVRPGQQRRLPQNFGDFGQKRVESRGLSVHGMFQVAHCAATMRLSNWLRTSTSATTGNTPPSSVLWRKASDTATAMAAPISNITESFRTKA